MRIAILSRDHRLRSKAEGLITDIYAQHHGATVTSFPNTLIARLNADEEIDCAAGLRFSGDGFFSEAYLDAPINVILSMLSASPVPRDGIFEVTLLATRSPHLVGSFLRKIMVGGNAAGFEWSFFTATVPLRALLGRLGISPKLLARADRDRVEDPDVWGSYYTLSPYVCAVERDHVAPGLEDDAAPSQGACWQGACWRPHAGLCERACSSSLERDVAHG